MERERFCSKMSHKHCIREVREEILLALLEKGRYLEANLHNRFALRHSCALRNC